MPAAKKKSAAPKPAAKKSPKKSASTSRSTQMDLFAGPNLEPIMPRMIPIMVPEGTPLVLGAPSGTPTLPPAPTPGSLGPALRQILSLDREGLRTLIDEADVSIGEIINLSTCAHGILYKLAAIGSKVTKRKK